MFPKEWHQKVVHLNYIPGESACAVKSVHFAVLKKYSTLVDNIALIKFDQNLTWQHFFVDRMRNLRMIQIF